MSQEEVQLHYDDEEAEEAEASENDAAAAAVTTNLVEAVEVEAVVQQHQSKYPAKWYKQLQSYPHQTRIKHPDWLTESQSSFSGNDRAEDEIDHISLSKKLRNIKSRLEASVDETDQSHLLSEPKETPLQRSPSSIMDRLARYQAATTNRRMSSSESESSDEDVVRNPDIVRETKDKEQVKFTRMNSLMSKWESGAVKNEKQAAIRNGDEEDPHQILNGEARARSMKQKFETGVVDDDLDAEKAEKVKQEKEKDMRVFRYSEENVVNETGAIGEKFKFFESYDGSPSVNRKRFQMTPPRESESADDSSDDDDVQRDPNVIRGSYTARGDIPRSNTASKMLNKFKAMESGKFESPAPREKKVKIPSIVEHSDNDDDDDDTSTFSSDSECQVSKLAEIKKEKIRVEPDKARNLRNKFENWQTNNNKENIRRNTNLRSSATCSNLRAKFEAKNDDTPKPKGNPPPKINRFVATIGEQEKCVKCSKRVYALEKIMVNKMVLHKTCFKCSVCSSFLSMNTYTTLKDTLYCTTHFKQLFAFKGNYDEGFGREQHKDKWDRGQTNGHNDNPESDHPESLVSTNNQNEQHPAATNGHIDQPDSQQPTPVTNGHSFVTNGSAHHHEEEQPSPIQSPVSSPPMSPPSIPNTEEEEKPTLIMEDSLIIQDSLDDTSEDAPEIAPEAITEIADDKCDNKLAELSITENNRLSQSDKDKEPEQEEQCDEKPMTISCVKVATSIHGYNNEIYETSTSKVAEETANDDAEDLLYENVTLLKEKNGMKDRDGALLMVDPNSKSFDMERSFASDDSLENYLQDSEEIEGFDVDAYLREGVSKRDDSDAELISH